MQVDEAYATDRVESVYGSLFGCCSHCVWVSCPGVLIYSKTRVKRPPSKDRKLVLKTNNCLIQVKSIAECSIGEHSAILLTFIKLPFTNKIFVLSVFEWPLYTGFTAIFSDISSFAIVSLMLLALL